MVTLLHFMSHPPHHPFTMSTGGWRVWCLHPYFNNNSHPSHRPLAISPNHATENSVSVLYLARHTIMQFYPFLKTQLRPCYTVTVEFSGNNGPTLPPSEVFFSSPTLLLGNILWLSRVFFSSFHHFLCHLQLPLTTNQSLPNSWRPSSCSRGQVMILLTANRNQLSVGRPD